MLQILMILATVLLLNISPIYAQSTNTPQPNSSYRIYNNNNEYQGKAEWRDYGRYRLYDKDNNYTGYIRPTPYGTYRQYDKNNNYKGSITTPSKGKK